MMILDGRIIILAMFTLSLWGLNAAAQRFDKNANRVKVNWVVALLAGSRNQCVIWRNLTIQIGVIVNFVCYSLLVSMTGHANLVITGILAFLIMFVLQQRLPKDCEP